MSLNQNHSFSRTSCPLQNLLRTTKMKIKNSNIKTTTSPSSKTESLSKYFTKQSKNKTPLENKPNSDSYIKGLDSKKVLNDSVSDDDFMSPMVLRKRNNLAWKLNPKQKVQSKKVGKKGKITTNSTIEIVKENFVCADENPEHLQMAIALSKSTYEAEYGCCYDASVKEETPDVAEILQNVKPTNLERFGFKIDRPTLPGDKRRHVVASEVTRRGRNRFKYITPILTIRSMKDREALVASKISLILQQSIPNVKVEVQNSLISSKLEGIVTRSRSIFQLDNIYENNAFYVENLNLPKSNNCKCGSLLKDWSSIPGRDKSPGKRTQNNQISCENNETNENDSYRASTCHEKLTKSLISDKKVGELVDSNIGTFTPTSSTYRSMSPDLFESDDECYDALNQVTKSDKCIGKANFANISMDGKNSDQEHVIQIETIDLTKDVKFINKNSTKSHTKPSSFYSLDEFEEADNKKANGSFTDLEKEVTNINDNKTKIISNSINENLKSVADTENKKSSLIFDVSRVDMNKSKQMKDMGDDEVKFVNKYLKEYEEVGNRQFILGYTAAKASIDKAKKISIDEKINTVNHGLNEDLDQINYLSERKSITKSRNVEIFDESCKYNENCDKNSSSVQENLKDSSSALINNITSPPKNKEFLDYIELLDESSSERYCNNSDVFENLEENQHIDSTSSEMTFENENNVEKTANCFNTSASLFNCSNFEEHKTDDDLCCIYDNYNNAIDVNGLNKGENITTSIKNTSQISPLNSSSRNDQDINCIEISDDSSSQNFENKLPLSPMWTENFEFNNMYNSDDIGIEANTIYESQNSESCVADIPKKDNIFESLSPANAELNNEEELCNAKHDATPIETNRFSCFKRSREYNSADLNVTDYVNNLLTQKNYSFINLDDPDNEDEVALNQDSQSSSVADDELNYSSLYATTPVKIRTRTVETVGNLDLLTEDDLIDGLENSSDAKTGVISPVTGSPITKKSILTPNKYLIKTKNVTPMPDYENMATPFISRELQKVGVKPLKRARGAELLKYIYESTHPLVDSVVLERSGSDDEGKVIKRRKKSQEIISNINLINEVEVASLIEIIGDRLLEHENPEDLVFERKQSAKILSCQVPLQIIWHNFLCSNPEVRDNILLYQPLQLESLHLMLKHLGFKFNIQDLLAFLDKKCITIRTAQKQRKRHR